MDLSDALLSLDPSNDNHWTQDGLPRLETLRMLVSNSSLSRDDVSSKFSNFSRHNFNIDSQSDESILPEEIDLQLPSEEVAVDLVVPVLNLKNEEIAVDESSLAVKYLDDEIALVEKQLYDIQVKLGELRSLKDSMIVEQVTENPQAIIKQYLESSKVVLKNRGLKMRIISESGIDLKQLASDLKSPLDASFLRRRQ